MNYGNLPKQESQSLDLIKEKKKMRKQNDPQNLIRPQIVFQSGKIKKWSNRPVSNWATVRNQLALDDKIQARILKYEND